MELPPANKNYSNIQIEICTTSACTWHFRTGGISSIYCNFESQHGSIYWRWPVYTL